MRRKKQATIYQRIFDPEVQRKLLDRGIPPEDLLKIVSDAWRASEAKRSIVTRLAFTFLPIGRKVRRMEGQIATVLDQVDGKPPVRG